MYYNKNNYKDILNKFPQMKGGRIFLTIYLSMLDTEQERKKMTDIYEEYKYALLHYAMKIMRNQDMAEDAVHNAFISIIQKKQKYLN